MIWPILMTVILFIVGLIILGLAADYLVTALVKAATLLHMSVFVIGSLVLAMATTLPELANNLVSAMNGVPALGLGNLIGAPITNFCLVFGIVMFFGKVVKVQKEDFREFLFILIPISLLALFIYDGFVGRIEGLILIGIYVANRYFLFKRGAKRSTKHVLMRKLYIPYLMVPLAIFSIIIGAFLIVDTSIIMATLIGVPLAIIGATVVSIGTTLPELSSGISAIKRGVSSLSFGNVLGAVATNLLFVLGLISVIFTISFDPSYFVIPVITLFAVLGIIILYITLRKQADRYLGIILLCSYGVYLTAMVLQII